MGTRRKFLIFIIAAIIALPAITGAQEAGGSSFRKSDSLTLALYNQADWKGLRKAGKEAMRAEIDYYYLRMRLGQACFETKNYLMAEKHFDKALEFNEKDPVAGEYLFLSQLEMNHTAEAMRTFSSLSVAQQQSLQSLRPRSAAVSVTAGQLFSNQPDYFVHFDLDGAENYYGEVDLTMEGLDFSGTLAWTWRNGFAVTGGYTFLNIEKNRRVSIGDSIAVDDLYPVRQHQFYLSGRIPVVKDLSIIPAVSYILNSYEAVSPAYHPDSADYSFPVVTEKDASVIAFLEVQRDFRIITTGLFAAYSNLNGKDQYQAGFHLLAYPFGNLNLYTSSRLLNHRNNGEDAIIFEQMAGVRVFRPLWAEVNATFGEMRNYHENYAFTVYNFADRMKFRGGARLIWVTGRTVTVTGEYIFLHRKGNRIVYSNAGTPEVPSVIPITFEDDFYNHIFLISLNMKLL